MSCKRYRNKAHQNFEAISRNRLTVEVVSCESDIEIVIMNREAGDRS